MIKRNGNEYKKIKKIEIVDKLNTGIGINFGDFEPGKLVEKTKNREENRER